MKVVIIEDEKLAAERLEEMLKKVSFEAEVVARIGTIKDAVRWFSGNKADLIFLDIQLADGLSFNIFEQVVVNSPVIFTTAYDQYALEAFRLNSIAYLLKPIRKTELEESLQKFASFKTAFSIDFDRIIAAVEGRQQVYKKRFLIQYGTKMKKVETDEIAYFFAQDKNVLFTTTNNQTYPADYTLDALETLLDPAVFFRINRKFLVNMDSIASMTAYSRGRIKLDLKPAPASAEDTIVSIERSGDFRKWVDR